MKCLMNPLMLCSETRIPQGVELELPKCKGVIWDDFDMALEQITRPEEL